MLAEDIEIVTGFAKDIAVAGFGVRFTLGMPPMSLTLACLPRRSYVTDVPIPLAIEPDEWLAVAVRRSSVEGPGRVLLAYRRLGQSGKAEPANYTIAAWLLFATVVGGVFGFLAAGVVGRIVVAAVLMMVAIPSIYRLCSVRVALQLLRQGKAPV
jgi:hypothetical protein